MSFNFCLENFLSRFDFFDLTELLLVIKTLHNVSILLRDSLSHCFYQIDQFKNVVLFNFMKYHA